MEQLLLHLFGDYVTQTDWMATNKKLRYFPALVHATVYSIPFLLLHLSWIAFAVILVTHFLIDHYTLARYVVYFKNKTTNWNLKWSDCNATGYPKETPVWLSTWLLIIADNFLHLFINYCSIRWL